MRWSGATCRTSRSRSGPRPRWSRTASSPGRRRPLSGPSWRRRWPTSNARKPPANSVHALVAAQRFAAFRAVVDDRFGITGRPIAFGESDVVGISELDDPAPHVVAGGIELLGLPCRVEHPEIRCGIGAASRGPLPAVLVAGHIAIDQLIEEPPGTPLPGQVQVLDQKRRN